MNNKMFLKVMKQSKRKVDSSNTKELVANTIKIVEVDGTYYAFEIDSELNKKLIGKADNEKKLYKQVLNSLGIIDYLAFGSESGDITLFTLNSSSLLASLASIFEPN